MNKLYKDLENLSVPRIEDSAFQHDLRRSLMARYHSPQRKATARMRVALAFACVLAVIGCASVINPTIAYRLNAIAFGGEAQQLPAGSADIHYAGLKETTLQNPDIAPYLPVNDFQEEKAYIIRKYTSRDKGAVMVVSEFGNKPVKMIQTGGGF